MSIGINSRMKTDQPEQTILVLKMKSGPRLLAVGNLGYERVRLPDTKEMEEKLQQKLELQNKSNRANKKSEKKLRHSRNYEDQAGSGSQILGMPMQH
ncbi:hypothetical protein V6N11_014158 [Hibiscus sabdariffa]|uniref:Uncharacterized protein n=1 Tax=Hibiscus sabdariffa TaxID=183260 RepID=A0ABR2AFT9_9ROSI